MTIKDFIKDPHPFNDALTAKLVRHALQVHERIVNYSFGISSPLLDKYTENWFKAEWVEMVSSIKDSTLDELREAHTLMIPSWPSSVIMDEIIKREDYELRTTQIEAD